MEVEFQNTKQDYIDFYKSYFKDALQKRAAILIIILIFVASAASGNQFIWWKCVLSIFGYIIFILLISYFIPLFIWQVKIKRLLSKEPGFTKKRRITITNEGLLSESETDKSLRNWESIKSVNLIDKFICIRLIDKKVLIIPKRNFSSDVEETNFLGLLQSRNNTTNLGFFYGVIAAKKPPYKWGYLGFIPLIGGINGLIMIVNGIIKYKDTKYALIGLAGLLFTVAVYSSLFYVGFKSNFGRQGFAQLSQNELNGLVKEVEFYKIQNGVYPDSLQQLDTKGSFTDIHDPLLNDKKPDTYNYHKVGNKYFLFSSGIDEIPNTADDIYPTVDTTHTGLIVKRR